MHWFRVRVVRCDSPYEIFRHWFHARGNGSAVLDAHSCFMNERYSIETPQKCEDQQRRCSRSLVSNNSIFWSYLIYPDGPIKSPNIKKGLLEYPKKKLRICQRRTRRRLDLLQDTRRETQWEKRQALAVMRECARRQTEIRNIMAAICGN